jgi:hypothetical protein
MSVIAPPLSSVTVQEMLATVIVIEDREEFTKSLKELQAPVGWPVCDRVEVR